ncbi:hypothetical protein, partial [Collimonas silvisoli]|uniref:hypothetical protein n=1 Tax=Collimonas silvisoli TaxID=2825884 RepID=UPI001B8C0B47
MIDAETETKNWYEPIPEVKCPPIGWIECTRAVLPPLIKKFDPEILRQLHGGEITREEAHRQMDEKEKPEKIVAEERQLRITAAIQKMPDPAHMQLMDVCGSGVLPREISLNQDGCILNKPYYRLTEAAELTGIAERDLLHHAIGGGLILLVPISDEVKITASICAAHEMQNHVDQIFATSIYPWRHEEFGKRTDLSTPNMLILSRLNCQKIDVHKEVLENCFEAGYRIDGNNIFYANPRSSNEYIKQVAISDSSQRFFVEKTAIWKTGAQNAQTGLKYGEEKIRIKFDDLFVMGFNLKALIDSLPETKLIPSTVDEKAGPWTTPQKFVPISATTKAKNGQPIGLSTPDIAAAFDGLSGWDAKKWKKNLTEAEWTKEAITHHGRAGNGGATF